MIIDSLQALPSTVTTGDELPVERGTTTYKIDYDALATAIIGKLGGDPVTVAHGGTGATTAATALAALGGVAKSDIIPSKIISQASSTTHELNVPSSSRSIVFMGTAGTTNAWAAIVGCSNAGVVSCLDLAKGANVTVATSTNKVTITLTATQGTTFGIFTLAGNEIT